MSDNDLTTEQAVRLYGSKEWVYRTDRRKAEYRFQGGQAIYMSLGGIPRDDGYAEDDPRRFTAEDWAAYDEAVANVAAARATLGEL